MPSKVVKITVRRNGKLTLDYEGWNDDCCFEVSAQLLKKLAEKGLEVGEPASLHCKLPTAPQQPDPIRSKVGSE